MKLHFSTKELTSGNTAFTGPFILKRNKLRSGGFFYWIRRAGSVGFWQLIIIWRPAIIQHSMIGQSSAKKEDMLCLA